MNKELLDFITALIYANPDLATELRTPNIDKFIDSLTAPEITENGKTILKTIKEHFLDTSFKTADIAAILNVTSRSVSGSLRKLVSDGFCDKIDEKPIIYTLTEKGKNFIIED